MNKQEYFKISIEQNLPNRCPLLGYCDRHAWTLYLFSQYNEVDYNRNFIKTLQKEGVLAPDYENKRTKLRSEEPSILRNQKYGHFSNMCPEVSLFDKDNSFVDFRGIACTDGTWDYKISKKNKVQILETKHFSECLEFSNSKYSVNKNKTIDNFINQEFDEISINDLGLDNIVSEIINLRIKEIKLCLNNNAPLSVIFLSGSTLEGILLGFASKYPKKFNQSFLAPKNKEEKVKPFKEWSLNNFIDTAHDIGLLKEDIKRYSHTLREFRNYIHPFEQINKKFNPDLHTAKLCWQVLRVAIIQLSQNKINIANKEFIKELKDIQLISVTTDIDNCGWEPYKNNPYAFQVMKLKSLFPIFNFTFINNSKKTILLTNIVLTNKHLPIGLCGPFIPLPNILRPLIKYQIKLPSNKETTNTQLINEIEIPQSKYFKFQVEIYSDSMNIFKPPHKYALDFKFGFNDNQYIDIPTLLLNSDAYYEKLNHIELK